MTTQPDDSAISPFPVAITSLVASPLIPVSTQSASKVLHGPLGNATEDHLAPFQFSVSSEPFACPTAHTSLGEIALIAFSGANGTVLLVL
jgi:hypothetical protein